jgi:hypothetical protein
MKQYESVTRLLFQACLSAKAGHHDEYVVDALSTERRIGTLIADVIAMESWRLQIYPLLRPRLNETTSLKAHLVMEHEAHLLNLLEVALFHSASVHGVEAAADSLWVELADYCYRKVTALLSGYGTASAAQSPLTAPHCVLHCAAVVVVQSVQSAAASRRRRACRCTTDRRRDWRCCRLKGRQVPCRLLLCDGGKHRARPSEFARSVQNCHLRVVSAQISH